MTASSTVRPVHPNKLNFIEGVDLIFDSWTAMKLAVEMEFAGCETYEKSLWLRSVIVEHFDAGIIGENIY